MRQLDFSRRNVSLKGLKELFLTDMETGSRKFIKIMMNEFMEIEREEFIQHSTLP